VDIYRLGRYLGTFRIHNINRIGLFLGHGPAQLDRGQTLALHFTFNLPHLRRTFVVRARVVHGSTGGSGLVYNQECEPEVMNELNKQLESTAAGNGILPDQPVGSVSAFTEQQGTACEG
jgi:hypothetical protein